MPVSSVAMFNFLRIARNSFGWKSINVFMLMLYVSDSSGDGFLRILTLIMWVVCSSHNSKLTGGIGGGSICA